MPKRFLRKDILLAIGIGILTFLIYLPSLKSGFVYDAEYQILNNDYIHTASNFYDVISFRVLGSDVLDNNRPVQLFSLMLDSLFSGYQPFGYHLTNILLHSFNAVLLVILLTELLGGEQRYAIACGALVFALHPVNVEVVAEVSSREDALTTFFVLSGLLLAIKFGSVCNRRKWLYAAASVLAFLLAVGAKETGIVGPFLLCLYWLLYGSRERKRDWVILIASAFCMVQIFLYARFALPPVVSRVFLHSPTYLGGSFSHVFLYQPRIWAFLIKNIFWPFQLSADYVPQNVAWITLPAAIATIVVFISAQIGIGWKNRTAFFGAAIFWLALAPVSNFIPIYRPLADRFLYLPMVGIALSVATLLVVAKSRRLLYRSLIGVCILSLCVLAALTWKREAAFENSLNLWNDTTVKSPFSVTAQANLGYALIDSGDYQNAIAAFQKALNLSKGTFPDAWLGGAIALEKSGQYSGAERSLQKAIELDRIYAQPQKLLEASIITRENALTAEEINTRISHKQP
ncbi:MAG: tetratricopeptide repeat protein [Chthoniobacterales bacterium]